MSNLSFSQSIAARAIGLGAALPISLGLTISIGSINISPNSILKSTISSFGSAAILGLTAANASDEFYSQTISTYNNVKTISTSLIFGISTATAIAGFVIDPDLIIVGIAGMILSNVDYLVNGQVIPNLANKIHEITHPHIKAVEQSEFIPHTPRCPEFSYIKPVGEMIVMNEAEFV